MIKKAHLQSEDLVKFNKDHTTNFTRIAGRKRIKQVISFEPPVYFSA